MKALGHRAHLRGNINRDGGILDFAAKPALITLIAMPHRRPEAPPNKSAPQKRQSFRQRYDELEKSPRRTVGTAAVAWRLRAQTSWLQARTDSSQRNLSQGKTAAARGGTSVGDLADRHTGKARQLTVSFCAVGIFRLVPGKILFLV